MIMGIVLTFPGGRSSLPVTKYNERSIMMTTTTVAHWVLGSVGSEGSPDQVITSYDKEYHSKY